MGQAKHGKFSKERLGHRSGGEKDSHETADKRSRSILLGTAWLENIDIGSSQIKRHSLSSSLSSQLGAVIGTFKNPL